MKLPKYYICPMSKNIVDVIIELNSDEFGLLPSRRQIDYDGGYVNNWNTENFYRYVKNKNSVVIERDHGGHSQGSINDNGYESFKNDSRYMNIIHIDPWKYTNDLKIGIEETIKYLKFIYNYNPAVKFEIGTEESIRKFNEVEIIEIIETIKNQVNKEIFDNIEYVVIQSGVGLDIYNRVNIGNFDLNRLKNMIEVGRFYNKKTKEHNGDYLSIEEIKIRFEKGLDAINIGPEIAQIETMTYIENMSQDQIDKFYKLCVDSKKWQKWTNKNFDINNKLNVILTCGHYLFSHGDFIKLKNKLRININSLIKENLSNKMKELITII